MRIFESTSRSAQQGATAQPRSAERGFTAQPRSAERGFTARPRSAQQGFTLLEMLVALAIFSLAGLALVRLQAVSARSAFDLRERTMAQVVAHNLMVERLTDPKPPALGSTTGAEENYGRAWPWRQGVAPLQDGQLLAVTIRVEGGPGESPAVLSFVRPAQDQAELANETAPAGQATRAQ